MKTMMKKLSALVALVFTTTILLSNCFGVFESYAIADNSTSGTQTSSDNLLNIGPTPMPVNQTPKLMLQSRTMSLLQSSSNRKAFDGFDDFSTDVSKWTVEKGEWTLVNGEYKSTYNTIGIVSANNAEYSDFSLEADITLGSNNDGGLSFRSSNPLSENGYYVGLYPQENQIRLYKLADTTPIVKIVSAVIDAGIKYHVKIEAVGSRIKIYVSDMNTPKIDAIDTRYLSGKIALRSYFAGASYDNVKVTYTDTISPMAPANLAFTQTENSISLSWQESTDNVGVVNYIIYRNNIEIAKNLEPLYDDTGLSPGQYTYYVKAVDAKGNLSQPSNNITINLFSEKVQENLNSVERAINGETDLTKDPVDIATGNFTSNNTDIAIDGYQPLTFTRYYSSLDSWKGMLGNTWHNDYEYKLTKSGDNVQIIFADGHLETFTENPDGSYEAMPGRYSTLAETATGFTLTEKDKIKYTFSTDGNLTSIEDNNGNRMNIAYTDGKMSQISNSCGRLQFTYTGDFISKITDNSGRIIEYTYTNDNLTAFKNVEGNTFTYVYDDKNRLLKIIDPLNVVTVENTFDDKNRATKQIMGDGTMNLMAYDDVAMTTTLTERNGAQSTYKRDADNRIYEKTFVNGTEKRTFDTKNQLTSLTDKNGNTFTYQYDTNGNISTETDALNQVTQYTYNVDNKVIRINKPDGSVYNYDYDSKGNMIKTTDPLGREFRIEYNSLGMPIRFFFPDGNKTEIQYDAKGNPISTKDQLGYITTNSYDALNRLLELTNPLGEKTSYEYTPNGKTKKVTNSDGTFVTSIYNAKGQLTESTDESGAKTKYEYNQMGRLSKTIDAIGRETNVQYDSMWNISKVTKPDGKQIIYTYNSANQLAKTTDENGNITNLEYDANNNLTKKTSPRGSITRYEFDAINRLKKTIDAIGNVTIYTRDANNNITSVKMPDGSEYFYSYDSLSNMTSIKDPLGREVSLQYNSIGLPIKVTLPDGSFTQTEYDAKGNPVSVKDAAGNITTFKYDALGRVVEIKKPMGNKTTFEYTSRGKIKKATNGDGTISTSLYDVRGLLSESTDEGGRITKYQYNALGKVVKITDPLGGTTNFEYDSLLNLCKVIKPDGNFISYTYNSLNQLISVINENGNEIKMSYDPDGNLIKETDAKGNATNYVYDALNRVIGKTNANNAITSFEYRYDGKIKKVADALNGITEYSYDLAGQVIRVKDPANGTKTYTYNRLGFVETSTDENGAITKYDYNPNGKVTKVTYPDNTQELMLYDGNGNLTKVTDAKGNTTTYLYDAMDRLIRVTNAKGGNKVIAYSRTGQVSTSTDENGNRTQFAYDALDRLIEVTDAKGNKTSYVYDAVGNLKEVHRFGGISQDAIAGMKLDKNSPTYATSTSDIVTKYRYDKLGQLLEETNPANKVMVYNFDVNGNLISKTDRDAFTTRFEFDAVNNLKKVSYQDGKTVEYTYDALNRVTAMKDWLGNNTFKLDAMGRIVKATNCENKTLEYTYTPSGKKNSIKYPDASSVKYEFDNMDRLTKVTDGQNKISQYKYDPMGNVVEKDLANGYKTYYKFDELSRLIKLANADATTKIVDSYEFKFDAVGNKTQGLRNGETTNYEYDALNQLTKVTEVGTNKIGFGCSPQATTTKKYFYDKLGNRLRLENWKNNNVDYAQDYKYDSLDRLMSITGKGITAPGEEETLPNGLNMEYDQRGNMIKMTSYDKVTRKDKVIATYTFDATNMMVGSTNRQGEKSTFVYDGAGRRVKTAYEKNMFFGIKKIQQMSYLLDVTKPYDNVLMIEGSETTGRIGDSKPLCNWSYQEFIEQKFTYGLEMLSVDKTEKNNLLRKNTFINRDYYLQDEFGSPIKIVDQSGRVEKSYKYDEFGRPIQPRFGMNCDRTDNVFSYTGYQYDAGTGLMYAQARYYMPSAGRFVSEDKLSGKYTDPKSLNRYVYVINNPLKFIDPLGKMAGLIGLENETAVSLALPMGMVLGLGDSNPFVATLQKALESKLDKSGNPYFALPQGANYGIFGNVTLSAVNRYKIDNDLCNNKTNTAGKVGVTTWKHLGLAVEGTSNTNISELERLCREPINSTWGISNSKVEEWFLNQNTAQPVINRYGLNSTNIKDVTAAIEAAGVSPVFFYTYTVNEGGGAGGFINAYLKDYYPNNGGDTAINAATGDAKYLADHSKMTDNPSWIDTGNPVDFVPQSVKNSGNASFVKMPSGSIGRAYIPATAATTWEVYYPDGLLKKYNTIQNYAAPLQGVMNAIKAMGGNF